jgi:hypothetical protein
MKVIIAGSRDWVTGEDVKAAMDACPFFVNVVVSGKARGADTLGERWAAEHGHMVAPFPADWDTHGKSAGPIRNQEMAEYAGGLVALWDGKSKGTQNMVTEMVKRGKPVFIWGLSEDLIARRRLLAMTASIPRRGAQDD